MKNKATLECYVTGQERLATPEEVVRQEYAKMLVEDYGYSKKDLIFEYPVKKVLQTLVDLFLLILQ